MRARTSERENMRIEDLTDEQISKSADAVRKMYAQNGTIISWGDKQCAGWLLFTVNQMEEAQQSSAEKVAKTFESLRPNLRRCQHQWRPHFVDTSPNRGGGRGQKCRLCGHVQMYGNRPQM
jgi:hypothetical protein